MNLKELKELFKLVEKTDFAEIDVTQGELRVNIKRKGSAGLETASVREVIERVPEPRLSIPPKAEPPKEKGLELQPKGIVVVSPFVGTFYRAPSPESKPFAEVGKKISKGETLCIVEAMKLMNEIECEVDGIIKEIYPQNAQPVEFGEKLFLIEPL